MTTVNEPEEAPKELARTLLRQGASVEDVMAKTTLSKPAILGIKGALIKADKRLVQASKPAIVHANPSEAISKPQIQIQAEEEPESEISLASPVSPFVVIDTPGYIAFRETLTKPQRMMLDGYADLGQKKWRQERNNGHDGHSVPSLEHDNSEDEVNHQYALYLKQKRMKLMTEEGTPTPNQTLGIKDMIEMFKLFNPQKTNEPLSIKDTLELAKFLGGSSTKETLQLVSFITEAANKGQAVTLNDIALKLEELKQTHDVEMRKLGFEEKKWEYQQEHSGKTIEQVKDLIKEVAESPIGKAIENLGAGTADRIRGQGGRMPMADVLCPNCGNKFKANPQLDRVTCNACGANLQKQQPQPSQPESESPEQTPSTELATTAPMNLKTEPGQSDF